MSKKEKKKLKKAKKRAARPEIYDPEKTESFEGSLILGYFLRLLTVAFAAFSVVFMFSSSFGISKEVNGFATFMFCLGTTLAVSLVFYGKWKLTLVGFGIIFAYIAVVNIAYGNPLTFFITGIDDLFDAIFSVIDERGFYVYDFVSIPSFGYADNLLKGGTYTLAFVVSLFFTIFSLRKARLTPFVILGSAVCAVCFIYNISESNWGISLLITALAAMVALARYDKVFIKNKLIPEKINEKIIKERLFTIRLLILKPNAMPFIKKAVKIRIKETKLSPIPHKTTSEVMPPVNEAKNTFVPLVFR